MESRIPFTGGSGRVLDRSLAIAGIAKHEVFITNVVHCHPPDDRPSRPHEIENCRPYLHRELEIVQPRLVIGLGRDAEDALKSAYREARVLRWPFTVPHATKRLRPLPISYSPDTHPGSDGSTRTPASST
jgi:uracil-DNA glycosylase